MTRRMLALILVSAAETACTRGTQAAPLRVGTTTTVEQSGALALIDSFHPPVPVRVVVGASGTIIQSAAAGVTPEGPRDTWYVQAGGDQAATVRIADERTAYALADLPTFTRLQGINLRVLFTADTALVNPYTLYVIRSAAGDTVARKFSTWALGDWRSRLLALRLPSGSPAFATPPPPGECTVPGTATAAER